MNRNTHQQINTQLNYLFNKQVEAFDEFNTFKQRKAETLQKISKNIYDASYEEYEKLNNALKTARHAYVWSCERLNEALQDAKKQGYDFSIQLVA